VLGIMFPNVAGGEWLEELIAYVEDQKGAIDVFCFQEVLDTPSGITRNSETAMGHTYQQQCDLYQRLQCALPDHFPLLARPGRLSTAAFPLYLCNATFVRMGRRQPIRNIPEDGTIMVSQRRDSMRGEDLATIPRAVLYATLELRDGKRLHALNFHGLWDVNGKHDTPARVQQAKNLRAIVERFEGPLVLGGDFNGLPNSDSARILEEAGLVNLVRTSGITGTRSPLYARKTRGSHADNVFVRGIRVVQFAVPETISVSDHLPLIAYVDL
jgi:endonuclease/exonuclease/phosphatase family metal-dependent hydrolase